MAIKELSTKASGSIAAMKRSLDELKEGYLELIRERDEALLRVNDLNAKINAASALFQAFGEEPPRIIRQRSSTTTPITASTPASGRTQRGKLKGHINEALKNGPLKVSELQSQIVSRFGVQYGLSSIYRVLNQGHDDKEYSIRARRWSIR